MGEEGKKIAIITARGGSKRIPRKNIKEFCGRPILAYSIEAAVSSGLFDEVMVSTEDEEIREVALEYGAKVPFLRSGDTANDYATTNDVLLEVLAEYGKRGQHFAIGACIYPTAPFVTARKLQQAMTQFRESDADALISMVQFSYPPQRALVVEDSGLVFQYPQYLDSRSQDLEPRYHDAGQFYFFRTEAFQRNQRLMVGNMIGFLLSELEVQDIDNQADWEIAEMKYRLMQENGCSIPRA